MNKYAGGTEQEAQKQTHMYTGARHFAKEAAWVTNQAGNLHDSVSSPKTINYPY